MDTPFVRVKLTKNKYALVDLDDLSLVSDKKWQAKYSKGNWYASHSSARGEIFMHNLILGRIKNLEVDHRNQNGLDNRRENLRHATKSQNRANVSLRKDNSSGYKGVSLYGPTGKWKAYIQENGKQKHLGFFKDSIEAAKAYNREAKRIFGEFAWLNQIH